MINCSFLSRNGRFSQRLSAAKSVQKAIFRARRCLVVFSAAGGALKTENSTFHSRSNQFSKQFKINKVIDMFKNDDKLLIFVSKRQVFSKAQRSQKCPKSVFFRALTCLGVFSAAGGALKTQNSVFDSNLINFQKASRSLNQH